jgi:hypothetical protein
MYLFSFDMESGHSALQSGLSDIRDLHLNHDIYGTFAGDCHAHGGRVRRSDYHTIDVANPVETVHKAQAKICKMVECPAWVQNDFIERKLINGKQF